MKELISNSTGFLKFFNDYSVKKIEFQGNTYYFQKIMRKKFINNIIANPNIFIKLLETQGISPDIIVFPLNLLSLAMIDTFKSLGEKTKVFGFESLKEPHVYCKYYSQLKYEKVFGIKPSDFFGQGDDVSLKEFEISLLRFEKEIFQLNGVGLVTDKQIDNLFFQKTGTLPSQKSSWIVRPNNLNVKSLFRLDYLQKAGLTTSLKLIEKTGQAGLIFLIPTFRNV